MLLFKFTVLLQLVVRIRSNWILSDRSVSNEKYQLWSLCSRKNHIFIAKIIASTLIHQVRRLDMARKSRASILTPYSWPTPIRWCVNGRITCTALPSVDFEGFSIIIIIYLPFLPVLRGEQMILQFWKPISHFVRSCWRRKRRVALFEGIIRFEQQTSDIIIWLGIRS